jgi:2-succinyl-6-hydroxy-2,4-cyclohexadiene-1-carboxylate synthase
MQLACTQSGRGPRVVFLHGFTQTSASWLRTTDLINHEREVVAVDLPGHGGSSSQRGDLWQTADAVADIGGKATYVGYSLGGRVALHVALRSPELVERLIVIGAHPGIEDEGERADRRDHDNELANHLTEIGVAAFIDEWVSQPLFASLPAELRGVELRRTNTVEGLAGSLRLNGTGNQESLWQRLSGCQVPTDVVVGELDSKFRPLAERLCDTMPNARLHVIDGAGHCVPLEAPGAIAALL